MIRIFINPHKAHKVGLRACKGKIKSYKVERCYFRNDDRSVDLGYRVALFVAPGIVAGWVRE